MKKAVVISCEHGFNTIPKTYLHLFAEHKTLLNTHRGIDFGALVLAEDLSKHFSVNSINAPFSRLLIDCNRTLTRPNCFSEITNPLPEKEKHNIIARYYLPYRKAVEDEIRAQLAKGCTVYHFSIHSFTPIWHGIKRNADIGLLYDPRRSLEKPFAQLLKTAIHAQNPAYTVRMNYPYKGLSDGFTTFLRKKFSQDRYLGFEIEINQAQVLESTHFAALRRIFVSGLELTLLMAET